ncbi:MAG: alkanesulfonate monooxygenase SsuD [Limisphaerales bacterium]|jgi:alkanesulfonate monooxygenase SsuD/methylene tetrahydromethanopterin reductase-like flavin-dependent oxidoreductase (luciferase family)
MQPLARRFGVCYDFRNPLDSGISMPDLYAQALEQIKWLDSLKLDAIWFTEHHFVDDGYLPAWIPVASAAAAVTNHVRFSSDICLLPFFNPVRLAEDLAVLDNISGGRVELGVGMGYAPHEFEGFGIPVSRRVSLMDEGLDVLKLAFTGEKFSYHGKRYQFNDVQITPGFVQEGGPPLWIAAMSAAGARRAAKYDAHFLPQGDRGQTLDVWHSERQKSDISQPRRIGIIKGVFISDNAEKDWPLIRDSERYRMQLYKKFFSESKTDFGAGEHIPQTWVVGNAVEVAEQLETFMQTYGVTDLITWGLPPGLNSSAMTDSLQQFVVDVVPRLRAGV